MLLSSAGIKKLEKVELNSECSPGCYYLDGYALVPSDYNGLTDYWNYIAEYLIVDDMCKLETTAPAEAYKSKLL